LPASSRRNGSETASTEAISAEAIALLRRVPGRDARIPAGRRLIRVGENPRQLMLLIEGQVEAVTRMQEHTRLTAPSIIGEISLLGQTPAVADVRTRTSVRIRTIRQEALLQWGEQHPHELATLYAELARVALNRLSGRYHHTYCAVVAHDGRKDELIRFIAANRSFFSARPLLATANTGLRIERETGLPVARRVLSGPVGGDQEIGALVSRGHVESVFFYRDPLWAQPHQADVDALVRVCEIANVPLATNDATARLLVSGLLKK